MSQITVVRLSRLPLADLQPLLEESREQGFEFLDRLAAEYARGTNRFDRPGEALFAAYSGARLVAIGGLNVDPYLPAAGAGRVRHLYVLSSWRHQGVGTRLMHRIIQEAGPHFRLLTLRTFRREAAAFYRAIGFESAPDLESASHCLPLPASSRDG